MYVCIYVYIYVSYLTLGKYKLSSMTTYQMTFPVFFLRIDLCLPPQLKHRFIFLFVGWLVCFPREGQ